MPGFISTMLPPLQFKASEGSYKNVKGMAKVRIRKRGYPDIVYMFGIQFIEDADKSGYIAEEPITLIEGGGFEFLPPRRSHNNKNNEP
jgi:hypothetical protein